MKEDMSGDRSHIIWNSKGKEYLQQKMPGKAIECFNKSIASFKSYASAWNNRGLALKQQGKYLEAIVNYEEALRLDSYFEKAWFNKGSACHQVHRHAEAIKCCEKTLELNPKYFKAWYKKGSSLAILERFDEALQCFDKVLELHPNNPDALKKKRELEERMLQAKQSAIVNNNRDIAEAGVNCAADESIESIKKKLSEIDLGFLNLENATALENVIESFFLQVKFRRLDLERIAKRQEQCLVCLEREKDMICVPCGHLCMCSSCGKRVHKDCPVCRQRIEKVIKVYK